MKPSAMGPGFSHSVLMHGSAPELTRAVLPFLLTGLGAGEPVVVCCTAATTERLDHEIGETAGRRVIHLDYEQTYASPAAAIAGYQDLADGLLATGARRIRVVGEAIADGGAEDHLDWARYEAAINHALQVYPIAAVCTYDRCTLTGDMLAYGRLTHPTSYSGAGWEPNPDYIEPAQFLRHTTRTEPYPIESEPPDLHIAELDGLDRLRTDLLRCLAGSTHLAQEAADLLLAANEVATNALRHGVPPVGVRLWVRPDQLVCVVTDHGPGIHDEFAGYLWPGALGRLPTGGMGLWMARRLCDRLDIAHEAGTCTVRLLILRGHTPPHPSRHRRTDLADGSAEQA